MEVIFQESSCSLLAYALNHCCADIFDPTNNGMDLSTTFRVAEVSKQHPTLIAKTLLHIAISMQQLPRHFDPSRLGIKSIEARIDKLISTVQSLITSDDELVGTVEGLRCLVLQGVFHINQGNPRRAWLTFRRALNVCKLKRQNLRSYSVMSPTISLSCLEKAQLIRASSVISYFCH